MVALALLTPVFLLASVTSQVTKSGPFAITGSPQVIPVGFPFQQASDLLVLDYGTTAVTHDPALVLVRNSDYTVTGGGYNGANQMQVGSITVVSTGANSVTAGDNIIIMRAAPLNQTSSFLTNGPLTLQLLEQMGDKMATLSQQVNELGQRSLHFENFETQNGLLSRSARAGFLLGFDASGNISYSTGGGGSGSTYTAGAGLVLAANEFSVSPTQAFDDLTVTNTIDGSITGNAATANTLFTPRAINGVNFNGSTPITVTAAAGTLTGTALNSTVTSAPGLLSASVGTFASMAIQSANAVAITGGTITGMPSPTNGTDVATKTYVDSLATGIVQRTGVQVATTINLAALSGEQTIDGVLTSTSRILVKNQTLSKNNGIYVTAAGAWARATDSDTAGELLVGYYYFVSLGTTQGSTGWTIQTAPAVLGTDPVVFGQFSASTTYTAGTGLSLAGNVFSLNAAQSGLTITGSAFNGTIGATTPSTAAFTTTTTTGNTYAANLVLKSGQLNEQATNGTASVDINYDGYAGGTTQFRNLNVYDGKNAPIATFTGATKTTALAGGMTAAGNVALTATRPEFNTTFTGDARKGHWAQYAVNGAHFTYNLTYDGTNWNRDDVASGGSIILDSTTGISAFTAAAGANPATLTTLFTAAAGAFNVTGTLTSSSYATASAYGTPTIINVKNYGATGNGVTDDTAAINTAVAAAASVASNVVLFFPPGKYMQTGINTLSGFTNLLIQGESAQIYQTTNANNTIWIDNTCTQVTVRGIWFNGVGTARANGIHLRINSDYTTVEDCRIERSSDWGIQVDSAGAAVKSFRCVNNTFKDTCGDGVHVMNVDGFVIANNTFWQCGDDAIAALAQSTTIQPANGVIANNYIYGRTAAFSGVNTHGFRGIVVMIGKNISITGNNIYNTYAAGIEASDEYNSSLFNEEIKVSDNLLYGCNVNGGPLGTIQMYFCKRSSVTNNQIINPVNASGIAFCGNSTVTFSGNTVSQSLNQFCRGIVTNSTTPYSSRTILASNDVVISNNNFDLSQASNNEGIYLPFVTGIRCNNLAVIGNYGRSTALAYITADWIITGKFVNNTTIGGTVAPSTGVNSTGITSTQNN